MATHCWAGKGWGMYPSMRGRTDFHTCAELSGWTGRIAEVTHMCNHMCHGPLSFSIDVQKRVMMIVHLCVTSGILLVCPKSSVAGFESPAPPFPHMRKSLFARTCQDKYPLTSWWHRMLAWQARGGAQQWMAIFFSSHCKEMMCLAQEKLHKGVVEACCWTSWNIERLVIESLPPA